MAVLAVPVLVVLFRHTFPDRLALAVYSCLSSLICPILPFVLPVLSCLSCSAYTILHVPFCLSCSSCPALPIPSVSVPPACPICLSCFVCPILPVQFFFPSLPLLFSPVLFCLSKGLPVLFWVSRYVCPVYSGYPFLAVLSCIMDDLF